MIRLCVNKDFTCTSFTKITSGSYNDIYTCTDNCVLKKSKSVKNMYINPELLRELSIYYIFKDDPDFLACHAFCLYYYPASNRMSSELYIERANTDLQHLYNLKSRIDIYKCYHQIARKVQKLHNINIIHGDIKPENILVCNGHYYLSDFGGSVRIDMIENCEANSIHTDGFVHFNESLSTQTDIYAVGITILKYYDSTAGNKLYELYSYLSDREIRRFIEDIVEDKEMAEICYWCCRKNGKRKFISSSKIVTEVEPLPKYGAIYDKFFSSHIHDECILSQACEIFTRTYHEYFKEFPTENPHFLAQLCIYIAYAYNNLTERRGLIPEHDVGVFKKLWYILSLASYIPVKPNRVKNQANHHN